MAPKITRKGVKKTSKDGEEFNSKAETDTEAIATADEDENADRETRRVGRPPGACVNVLHDVIYDRPNPFPF